MATHDMVIQRGEMARSSGPIEILGAIRESIKAGLDPKELYAIFREEAARTAAAEFNAAFAEFQSKCGPIIRNCTATVISKSGAAFGYRFADLSQIATTIAPLLTECGLSYSFDAKVTGANIEVSCKLRHINGHSETATITIPTESGAGMSPQQKVASAQTFAMRQALRMVLGLTTIDPDDDGASHVETKKDTINDEQARTINDMVIQCDNDKRWTSAEGRAAFFRTFTGKQTGGKVADILAAKYGDAVAALQKVLSRKAGAA